MSKRKATVRFHSYGCHPETCNHRHHDSWWVYNNDGDLITTFAVERNAEVFAKEWEEMFIGGDKIVCIDDSKQKVLKLGEVYTVDYIDPRQPNRVWIQEYKRFSFLISRFEHE